MDEKDIMEIKSEKSDNKNKPKVKAGTGLSDSTLKARDMKTELDLRGFAREEALDTLDKYIDDAGLSGLKILYIIHGKGTGTLRSSVTSFLKKDKRVKSFRPGEYGEGDAGVTVVTLQ